MIDNTNIRRRRSIRLNEYDYSQAGLYFITICVKDKKCLFGEIYGADAVWVKNFQPPQEMILNDAGKIADNCWLEIPKHFPNVVLHEYIIMPNHVHGIIELKRVDNISDKIGNENVGTRHVVSKSDNSDNPVGISHVMSIPNHVGNPVGTRHVVSLHDNTGVTVGTSHVMSLPAHNQFSKPIPGSISVIIQQYKSSVTGFINKNNILYFQWQSRFYEHIIRDDQSYEQIADYIINNPKNWKNDELFDFNDPA